MHLLSPKNSTNQACALTEGCRRSQKALCISDEESKEEISVSVMENNEGYKMALEEAEGYVCVASAKSV